MRWPIGRSVSLSWSAFVHQFVAAPVIRRKKSKTPGLSFATFTGNRRAIANVERVHAITLDFDRGAPPLEKLARVVVKIFPQTKTVIHSTFSHSIESPRMRVIVPLSRAVSSDEYDRVWDFVARKIKRAGYVLDESTRDASRFWFVPAHKPGAAYEWVELPGKSLSVSRALRVTDPTIPRPLPETDSRLKARPRSSPTTGNGRDCVVSAEKSFFGIALKKAGLVLGSLESGALAVKCPWRQEHTSGLVEHDTSTVILPPTTAAKWGLLCCLHDHCRERTTIDLLDVLDPKALEAARREHGSGLVRCEIRGGFVERLEKRPGFPVALDRLVLRCRSRAGVWIAVTAKVGSRAHVDGLDGLSLDDLVGRRIDLALRDDRITWVRLVLEEIKK